MDLTAVAQLAVSLMSAHDVDRSIRFEFDNAKVRAGAVHSYRIGGQVIVEKMTLSRHLMALWTEEQVRNTILHEIAHILAGPTHQHDRVWQDHARRLGIAPERCYSADDHAQVEAPWTGVCPEGHEIARHRRPAAGRRHSCGDPSHPGSGFRPHLEITWHRTADLRRQQEQAAATAERFVAAEAPAEPLAVVERAPRPVPASEQGSLF